MTLLPMTADPLLNRALEALRKGDKLTARRLASQVASLAPDLEIPWLILSETSSSKASLAYLEKAIQINPDRSSSKQKLLREKGKLENREYEDNLPGSTQPAPETATSKPNSGSRAPILGFFTGLIVINLVFWGWRSLPVTWLPWVSQNGRPAAASELQNWSSVNIQKPTHTPTITPTQTLPPTPTLTNTPYPTETLQPTLPPNQYDRELSIPTSIPLSGDDYIVQAGDTLFGISQKLGVDLADLAAANSISLQSVIYTGQSLVVPQPGVVYDPIPLPQEPPPPVVTDKYVLVDISEQHLYAYESNLLVFSFVASTGMNNATRTGSFSVLDKIPNAYGATWDLWMPNWLGIYWAGSLENGIHALPILSNGTQLWAGYLGTPISFGCIVLGVNEAQQLYDWVDIGTPVEIQW